MELSGLLTSLGMNLAICALLLSLYSVLRNQSSNRAVYFARCLARVQSEREEHDPHWFERFVPSSRWIVEAWDLSEKELLEIGGLDAVVFIKILVFSFRVFSIASIICFVLVLPVNYFGKEVRKKKINAASLEVFTIQNISERSEWLWAHCLALHLICFSTWILLYFEYKNVGKLRLAHLRQSFRNPSHFAVLVRGVPRSHPEEEYSTSLRNFFMKYYPSSYITHQMVYRCGKMVTLMKEAERVYDIFSEFSSTFSEQLEGSTPDDPEVPELEQQDDPEVPELEEQDDPEVSESEQQDDPEAPELKQQGDPKAPELKQQDDPKAPELKNQDDPKAPALKHQDDPKAPELKQQDDPKAPELKQQDDPKVAELKQQDDPEAPELKQQDDPVSESEERSVTGKESGAGFVFFRTRYAAATVAQARQSSHPMSLVTCLAPEPADVYWSNLCVPFRQLWMRRIVTILATSAFLFFFFFLVTLVQGLANLHRFEHALPFLKGILKKRVVNDLITGYLPSLILTIFLYMVPPLMMLFSTLEGSVSRSERKRATCLKVLHFNIWNVFFINLVSGTIVSKAPEGAFNIPATLAIVAIPALVKFFFTYVLTSGWISLAVELAQLYPIVVNFTYKCILRKKNGPYDTGFTFPFHTEVPRVLLFALLGFVFAVLAPLILPLLVIYFSLAFIVYRNQILNVYLFQYDTGGQYWPMVHGTIIFSMVLGQVLAIGAFAAKLSPTCTVLTILLVCYTLLFHEFCRQRFQPMFEGISAQEIIEMDLQDEASSRDDIYRKLLSSYSQHNWVPYCDKNSIHASRHASISSHRKARGSSHRRASGSSHRRAGKY